MEQIGFRMQLNAGQAVEYRRRHDEIWPQLVKLLKEASDNKPVVEPQERMFYL